MEEHGKELAGYIANENENLKKYGTSMTYEGSNLKTTSTKYATVYPFDSSKDNTQINHNDANLNTANIYNYRKNTLIYGDAINETSTEGTGSTSWYNDSSYYPGLNNPYLIRGGHFWNNSNAGLFYFYYTVGDGNYVNGFRVTLILS